jgi:hypothetical protein
MQIKIATSNQNKIRRLESLIRTVNPEISTSNITDLNIPAPVEDGKSQTENLMIKLNYYHKLLGGNVIAEDDIIKLQVGNEFIPIISINSVISTNEDQFVGWKSYLKERGVTRARLVKCYGTIIDNKVGIEEVMIPLIVDTRAESPNQNEKNILNNFIGPETVGKTYVEMTTSERDAYMQTMCLPALTKLLTR